MTSLACTVNVGEVIDALESDHAAPEHRLPGLSNDPSFGLVVAQRLHRGSQQFCPTPKRHTLQFVQLDRDLTTS